MNISSAKAAVATTFPPQRQAQQSLSGRRFQSLKALAGSVPAVLCLFFSLPVAAQAASDSAFTDITLTVTDAANGDPLANAVVEVVGSGNAEADDAPAVMAQEHHEFTPHLLTVHQGQAVDFPNRDDTRHHVYSFSETKPFNIELYADRPKAPLPFNTPGVVELGCNIHDRMQAFVYVARFAENGVTDANGQVRLTVPTGDEARLKVWHERLPDNTRSLEKSIEPGNPGTFTLQVNVAAPPAEGGAFSDLQKRFDNL